MPDTICRLNGSLVQHGPCNDRIYVMKLGSGDPGTMIGSLTTLAQEHTYSKVVVKAPSRYRMPFLEAGFTEEARIPSFFPDTDDCLFLSKFFSRARMYEENAPAYDVIIGRCRSLPEEGAEQPLPPHYTLSSCSCADAGDLARFYASVFSSYPFPIHNPDHIRTMMRQDTRFCTVLHDRKLAAAASAEMDSTTGTVEMTDFATSPEHRGKGLARRLLMTMETDSRERDLRLTYTIARAGSLAMNAVFARSGYRYGGRLINNTHIGGSLESMNVWYRNLI